MTSEEISIEVLRFLATQLGLNLSEEEMAKIAPGFGRNRRMAQELRSLLQDSVEPAAVFSAVPPTESRR